ncbi:LamG-like jellyroll fold domain-containing protein [Halorussus halobius]|uniref:LamG-like jellyroll fold domain-containing protein n=1 Tax=Halorussus halobius TaxID=1710537 RepID=UPI0010921B5D|nr:LamG-like jellyroll fold domain-containing protein [Halorussus halobius]
MTDVREATDDLLAEKPHLESELREVLAVDADAEGWTFDEVPVDSGTFGELVSRGVVVDDGDEYEVADPRAVQASLDGETDDEAGAVPDDGLPSPSLSGVSAWLPSVSRVEAGALAGALAFVALMRTYIFPSVFRGEYVVLPSNDPYYYRYWVEQLASEATGVFDFSVLSGLPNAVAQGEPLMVGTLWWVTNLLGGADVAGAVLAWYPAVAAVVTAALVYVLAVRVTGDPRVGVASVLLLAVVPSFAYRTGLGFADHHAFDYPWLVLTAVALAGLARVDRDDLSTLGPWLAAGVLGFAVTGQVLAWEAGPLLVGAIGVYVAVRAVADVRADRSPLTAAAPILAGLALAAVFTHLAHVRFGWHADVVAYAPVLLLVGVAGVALLGELVRRARMPAFVLGAAEVAGGLGGLALIFTFLPSYASVLNDRLDFLLFRGGIAENQSIFAGGPQGFFLGPILELGLVWFLGLPVLAFATLRVYRRDHPTWLVLVTYGWYFLLLASLQRRFVGEFSAFVAVAAGWGFVALAAKLDVARPLPFGQTGEGRAPGGRPRTDGRPTADGGPGQDGGSATGTDRSLRLPSRSTASALAVMFLLVASVGGVQTAVRNEQVKIDDERFQAATWMDGDADDRALEYPDDYVFSQWGRNRMYNYFVNGESRTYGFAEANYEAFLSDTDTETWYERLRDRPTGFVVTKNVETEGEVSPVTNYATLHQRYGSSGPNDADGAAHFRAVYASDDESVKAFTPVPGATITGKAQPNTNLTTSTEVDIEGGSFTYERAVSTNEFGIYEFTVPYSGSYDIGDRTVEVSEDDVSSGEQVNFLGDSGAYWPFESSDDDTAYDIWSGNHMNVGSGEWVEGHNRSAIALNQSDSLRADASPSIDGNESATLSTWFRAEEGVDYENDVKYPRIALKGEPTAFENTTGYQISMSRGTLLGGLGDGPGAAIVRGPRVDDGEWHHAVLTWNGSTVTLYLDGTVVGRAQWSGDVGNDDPFSVGQSFPGAIDDLRIYERPLSTDEVTDLYSNNGNVTKTDQ